MSTASATTHEPDSPAAASERSAEPPLFGLALARVRSLTAAPTTPELDALHDQPELAFLREIFDLDRGELDVLLTCLAFALDPSLADTFARVSGSTRHRYPTEPLVARLFGWGHRRLLGHGNLLAWSLVRAHASEPAQPPALELDPQLLGWLQDGLGIESELRSCASFVSPRAPLPSWPVTPLHQRLEQLIELGQRTRIVLLGPPGSGRRTLAAALAARFDARCIALDTDEIPDDRWLELYVQATRCALLTNALLVVHGQRIDRRWPRHIPPPVLHFVSCEDPHQLQPLPGVVDEHVELPALGIDERRALWSRLVPASAWSTAALDKLATRHRLLVGDIVHVARRRPATPARAAELAREQTRGRLGELGRLLDCPFAWDDLIVTAKLRDELEDFTFEAAERAAFWDDPTARRLFPRGTGLVGLLTGTPGTGKTMAAQVIAASLELDLFRIDLATVVSKYIGETAKNLRQLFSRSARMNAVLLFDEADALFAKRTEVRDAHDRHANADTNYLLQLLEDYQGIALLATNKKNNLDPAFTRRIRYVLDFPRPDPTQRQAIWRKVTGELCGPDALRGLEPTLALLAQSVDVSGAQIKNTLLAALFIAKRTRRPLDIDAIMRGLDRELGKEGRALSDRERARLRRIT